MQANGITNPNTLQVNQELKLPRSEAVRTQVSQAPTVIHSNVSDEDNSTPALLAQAADQAYALDVDRDPVIANLKEEVMRLREEFRVQGQQPANSQPEQETRVSEAPTRSENNARDEQPTNPEWIRQRLQKPNAQTPNQQAPNEQANVLNVPVEDRRQPQVVRRQGANTESASNEQTANNRPNEPRLMAAAPAPAQGYNRLLQLPSGQTVEPQIPPLPEGDQYLPERPQEFNGYMWPARGTLTSGYGPRWGRMHKGIDIAAPTGTPIYAAASGVVETAGWNNGGYGNLVDIRHPDGSMTRYAHNSKVVVRKGQRVEQGDQIALMGSTGYSTGPHLHFEVHPAGQGAANPMAFLPSNRN
ncbi:MAG: M23 family metallopeptidase [Kamptonema sp. SIO4C4]|nr:M23 family metallopeptidase [Kamptonema sp. SIO4C4]